ncbi:hypothetical protein CALVIDRAFT_527662 [Calocera viscosa TUFC12733]|uniref:Uncharacterized protein n=1 Tax=Calocera viscosa (strain TUFC12733) TaxID=1330018 RepID=A0A167M1P1_CALVF|nr:hypothetical protein CALVIDRAFT_527662 [Calocera viscosa TUFC12733]
MQGFSSAEVTAGSEILNHPEPVLSGGECKVPLPFVYYYLYYSTFLFLFLYSDHIIRQAPQGPCYPDIDLDPSQHTAPRFDADLDPSLHIAMHSHKWQQIPRPQWGLAFMVQIFCLRSSSSLLILFLRPLTTLGLYLDILEIQNRLNSNLGRRLMTWIISEGLIRGPSTEMSPTSISRTNPKGTTIYLGGHQWPGHSSALHIDDDGHIKMLPLFPEITDRSVGFSFGSPNGLLYATHLSRWCSEKVAFEDVKSKTFSDAALHEVVDVIDHRTQTLLEIVNLNIEDQQCVCMRALVFLQRLTNVLNRLKENVDISKLTKKFSVEKVREMLDEIVDECYKTAKAVVTPLRACLTKKINATQLGPDILIGNFCIELFALFVRWIETQELIFARWKSKSVIETSASRRAKNVKEICYQFEDEVAFTEMHMGCAVRPAI